MKFFLVLFTLFLIACEPNLTSGIEYYGGEQNCQPIFDYDISAPDEFIMSLCLVGRDNQGTCEMPADYDPSAIQVVCSMSGEPPLYVSWKPNKTANVYTSRNSMTVEGRLDMFDSNKVRVEYQGYQHTCVIHNAVVWMCPN
jgi:hypothetical protein